jgi:uncharacterized protein YfaS (alpha-2-macroglobulin family)
MMTRVRMGLLVTFAALALLLAIPIAQATTAVGSQNPQLTVRASAASDGTDLDRATVGDTVTIASSVKNNTARARTVTITYTLEDPTGRFQTLSETVRIGAHKTFSRSFSYVVDPSYPKGVYELTVSATNSRGSSSAKATLEIY